VSNSQIASDIASDEVMTENPPQHEPNSEMATTTNNDSVLIPEISVPELTVPEQTASKLTTNIQSTTTNFHEPESFTNPNLHHQI